MSERIIDSHFRSILKGISWRLFGTVATVIIAYFITGSTRSALQIGGIEVLSKFVLYYLHERIWQSIPPNSFKKN